MFLFILESIGTQEIILIGAVAFIVFGPRRLPEMMKTVGKAMAKFKNANNNFKTSWEREILFEGKDISDEQKVNSLANQIGAKNTISNNILPFSSQGNVSLPQPEELSVKEFEKTSRGNDIQFQENQARIEQIQKVSGKTDWL